MKVLMVGILLVLASCNGQKKARTNSAIATVQQEAPLTLVLQDEYSGFELAETMIIKDQKRLNSFYSKINQTRKPGLAVPQIDFSKEMVILQCSGVQDRMVIPTLAFQKETDLEITLVSELALEAKNSMKITTYPFCLYKMPLSEKKVIVIAAKNKE